MALIAAHLNAGVILSVPLPPFSPSLISLVVSVDVKHRVYLLTLWRTQHKWEKNVRLVCGDPCSPEYAHSFHWVL